MITGMLHLSDGNSGYEKFVQEAGIERIKGQGCPSISGTPSIATAPGPVHEAESAIGVTGIAGCCARAASGHAAAPPTSVMNSRRLMCSPRTEDHTLPHRTSGSMSGDGKRGAGHRPQATALILDSTEAAFQGCPLLRRLLEGKAAMLHTQPVRLRLMIVSLAPPFDAPDQFRCATMCDERSASCASLAGVAVVNAL
jgi:hypothetical protein